MIRAIIFDCFGVIITDVLEAIRSANPDKAIAISNIVGQVNRGYISSHDASTQIAEILGTSYDEYRAMLANGEVKNTQLLAHIKQLRTNYRTAMLSNIGKQSLARRFTDEELTEHFDVVVASGEIGYAKPDPEAYQITAARLGVDPEECVFIDDRQPYVMGAKAVGMQGIVYADMTEFMPKLTALLDADK